MHLSIPFAALLLPEAEIIRHSVTMNEELAAYEAELDAVMAQQCELLENDHLVKLKQAFRDLKMSFDGLHNVLKKNGVLREDPYKYEEKLSEINTPADDQFLESDRDQVLSLRLAQYEQRLDFLTQYVAFTVDHLNLRRLKDLVQFSRFINWRNLSETTAQPTTRGLAELIAKIKAHGDSLSNNIVQDARDRLDRLSGQIGEHLKHISAVQRERYKLAVRQKVLPQLPASVAVGTEGDLNARQLEDAMKRIRALVQTQLVDQPFVRDLIAEVFAENHPTEGAARRAAVLEAMRVQGKATEEKSASADLRPMLIDAIRSIATAGRPMQAVVRKLEENVVVLEHRKLSLGETLLKIWQRMRGETDSARTFPIEFADEATGTRQAEELEFETFVQGILKRSRVYASIQARNGNSWRKLQNADEEQLLSFATKEIQALTQMLRRAEALDTYLRAEVPREERNQLQGINIETTSIQEHVQRGRTRTREYVAKKDEIEQLRRLGIKI